MNNVYFDEEIKEKQTFHDVINTMNDRHETIKKEVSIKDNEKENEIIKNE